MRKYRTDAAVAANQVEPARADAPAYWVCMALLLAMIVLAARIAAIW
ncbi:hypothetical protein [Bradyrhizobium sp.]